MKIILSFTIFIFMLIGCAKKSNIETDFYSDIATHHLNTGLNVVIPIYFSTHPENVLTTLDIVYDNIFRQYRQKRYNSFEEFFRDIMRKKIKIKFSDYNLISYEKIEKTKIYEEYKLNGKSYIIKKYLIPDGETKNEKLRYISIKNITSAELNDLKRVLFNEKFIILESDIVEETVFIHYK